MDIDSDDRVHVVFAWNNQNTWVGGVYYAAGGASGWTLSAIGTSGNTMFGAALELDAYGDPHVVYADDDLPAIRYAYRY